MPEPSQPPFQFDPTASPKENIDRFADHLRKRNPQLTDLLVKHLDGMLPLSDDAQERASRRQAFNAAIVAALDATETT